MTRQILIVVGAALLSDIGFALVLAIAWLTLHLVLGYSPYLLQARLHSMSGVLSALFTLAAFIGAGCATSVLISRRDRKDSDLKLSTRPRLRG